MAITLPLLRTLNLAQLKNIALKCGISSSGTKSVLSARLLAELPISRIPSHGNSIATNAPTTRTTPTAAAARQERQSRTRDKNTARLLSIDMGIRNLAYCVFDIALPGKSSSSAAPIAPSLIAWERVAVSPKLPASSAVGTKENFEPTLFATLAYNLITQRLLTHDPTLVLIERQRYRSAGSSAIQEWTVRVNMLEGMLYAVLETLQAEGRWSGSVQAVTPAKVGGFWIGGTAPGTAKTAKLRNKAAKIDLVGEWLDNRDSGLVNVKTQDARRTVEAFLQRWRGKGKRTKAVAQRIRGIVTDEHLKKDTDEGFTKLDDLADCFLQGVAWTRWEENRLRIINEGVLALEETD